VRTAVIIFLCTIGLANLWFAVSELSGLNAAVAALNLAIAGLLITEG
jgi:hypothetical protein